MRKVGLGLDLVAVLVFVGIGRDVHSHGLSLVGMASTTWPFAVGLAAGWLAVTLAQRDGALVMGGVIVVVATVALGMILRVVSGQGTAFAFILVTFGFLGATMLGWRIVAAGLTRWAARRLQTQRRSPID